jgi:hypothetical protein
VNECVEILGPENRQLLETISLPTNTSADRGNSMGGERYTQSASSALASAVSTNVTDTSQAATCILGVHEDF